MRNFPTFKQIKLKKQQKLMLKQGIAAIPAILLIVLLAIPLFNFAPPLGEILQPRGGLYDHLDDGVHPDLEIIRDARLFDDVTVYRDEWGVPHIFANHLRDMAFAEGYCMALDRMFEIDLLRRVVTGRLAELIPAPQIPGINLPIQAVAYLDSYFRFYGLHHAAQKITNKLLAMQAATPDTQPEFYLTYGFIDGVNVAIQKMVRENRLPIEYSILNTIPAPYTEVDMASVALFAAFMLSMSTSDLDHTALYETLGEYIEDQGSKYAGRDFSVLYPEVNGTLPYQVPIIPDNDSMFKSSSDSVISQGNNKGFIDTIKSLSTAMKLVGELLGFNMDEGVAKASNNWVVSGSKTVNGKPILCSDPHLVVMQPAIFYEVHLTCKTPFDMNVHGVAFPGAPIITIGFNDKIAWGITSHSSDNSVDYYHETLNEDGTKYLFNGEWRNLTIYDEVIRVRNGEDLKIRIRYTHHGPIISDFIGFDAILGEIGGDINLDLRGTSLSTVRDSAPQEIAPISMSWVAEKDDMHDRNILSCMLQVNLAKNRADFEKGLNNWTAPPQNLAFACIDGDIGMYLPGLHPVREKNGELIDNGVPYSGSFVQPGNGSGEEWIGFLNFSQIPKSVNPLQGYLASANQRTIAWSDASNITVGRTWTENYRARRINHLLNTTNNITIDTMKGFQADIHDVAAERFVPPLLEALTSASLTGDHAAARQEILSWNASFQAYDMRKELVAPLIFDMYLDQLENETWSDEWNVAGATGLPYPSLQYLEYMIQEDKLSPWFDDVTTAGMNENATAIMITAFKKTVNEIIAHRGSLVSNRTAWLWGNNHKFLPVSIPMALGLLLGVAEQNAVPYGGSGRCLRNSPGMQIGGFTQLVSGGPAWRHIVDFSNNENPITVMPVGNSGVMFSTHWDDQFWLYVNCQYKTVSRASNATNFLQAIESTVLFRKI